MCKYCAPTFDYGRAAIHGLVMTNAPMYGAFEIGMDLKKGLSPAINNCECKCQKSWIIKDGSCRKCRHIIALPEHEPKLSEDVRSLYEKAHDCIKQRDYNTALTLLTQALQKEDDFYGIYYLLALASLNTGKWNQASKYCELWLRKNGNAAWSYYLLGVISYQKDKDYKGALSFFNHAIALDPSKIESYIFSARCSFRLNKYDNALKYLNKALEINPDSINALIGRAYTFMKLGRKDSAKEDLEKVLTINPNNNEAKELILQLGS